MTNRSVTSELKTSRSMKNQYIGVVLTNRFGGSPDRRERGQVWIRFAYRLTMAAVFQDRKVSAMARVQKSIT
jgi:hypothetical protein